MERQKNSHIKNFIDELEREVYHPILKRDARQVKLEAEKAFYLLLPLLNGEDWTEQMNTAAIAVGSVHAALDAHDSIDRFNATSKSQQLTVLSGDYFSGIHYKLLASLSDFNFMRALSLMIGRINEVKTVYHGCSPTSSEELIETVQLIESGCITEFLHAFGFSRYAPLAAIALPLIRMNGLSYKQSLHNGLGWNKGDIAMEQVITELQLKMSKLIDEANFISPLLKEEIRGMTMPLLGKPI